MKGAMLRRRPGPDRLRFLLDRQIRGASRRFSLLRNDDWFPEPMPMPPSVLPEQFVPIADDGTARALADTILRRLRCEGVHAFEGGSDDPEGIRINLEDAEYGRFIRLLSAMVTDPTPCLIIVGGKPRRLKELVGADARSFEIGLPRYAQRSVRTEAFGPQIEIVFWRAPLSYADSPVCVSDRSNWLIARASSFGDVCANIDRTREIVSRYPRTMHNTLEIDVVYTWVDDGDPGWRREKDHWAAKYNRPTSTEARALHRERFRNRDELRYSLRSLEMFAPWVRRIFIVTADQTPSWLNTDHPKIRMVSHRDIYRDPDALPTFNSSGIETQLHHIEGLSEHFVYFNDDMFLGQRARRDDFFHANGIARFYRSRLGVVPETLTGDVEEYLQADVNAVHLFRDEVGIDPSYILEHVPYAGNRSVLDELEARFPEAFHECATRKFRSPRDIRPIAFMHPHYAFATGRAVPSHTRYRYLALWKPTIVAQLRGVQKRRGYKFFCLNDVGLAQEREEVVGGAVDRFLRSYFPRPSGFERIDPAMEPDVHRSSAMSQ